MSRKRVSLLQRLRKFVVVAEESQCWVWTGAREEKGYGKTKIAGKQVAVHRAVYELLVAPIPTGMSCCHRCDNPSCCNPDHLFLGTQRDNINDMLAKNRQSSKLNPEQVREIRKIYKHGGITQKQIAEQYGVSRHTITDLLDGTTWKHVKDEDN